MGRSHDAHHGPDRGRGARRRAPRPRADGARSRRGPSARAAALPAGAPRRRPPVTPPQHRVEQRGGWLFVTPALLLIGVFFVIPVLGALLLSFTDFDIYSIGDVTNTRFIGLGNYRTLFTEPLFWTALRNTVYYVVVGGPLSLVVSLAAALLINAKLVRWKPLFRSAFFAPWVTTLVAVALVWRYMYHPQYGLLNAFLGQLGVGPIDWLGNPHWAMPAIIVMSVWKNFGYNMLIFLAGLQTIPPQLYEAAELDGAGQWQRFRQVTVPMLGPTFVFVGVVTMIAAFQIFSEPYVMTQGGPLKSTLTLVLFMYEQGFRWWRLGFAAAVAVVLGLLILAGTAVQLGLRRGGARVALGRGPGRGGGERWPSRPGLRTGPPCAVTS